jgi:hypothetical protein
MELLGPDLVAIREKGSWSIETIASATIAMIDIVERLHSLGYAHTDTHTGNWLLSYKSESPTMKLVDFGYLIPLEGTHPRKSSSELIIDELRQIALNSRYLVDKNMKFYQRSKYEWNESEVCSSLIDTRLCEAIKYVYNVAPAESKQVYQEFRSRYSQILGTALPDLKELAAFRKVIDGEPSQSISTQSLPIDEQKYNMRGQDKQYEDMPIKADSNGADLKSMICTGIAIIVVVTVSIM